MADPAQLTALHRRQQLHLRRTTVAELKRLWPALNWAKLDATYPDFAQSVAAVVARNRQTSMGLASRYLRAFRVASGIPGELKVVLPETLPAAQTSTALRVTSVVSIKKAAARGESEGQSMSLAQSAFAGAMVRLVLQAGRDTIIGSAAADPEASGWQRVLGGSGCDFCAMLAGRGSVYSADTADFASHDHCGCSAAPVYEGAVGSARAVRAFTPSTRNIPQADKDRVRKWLKDNPRS